MMKIMIAFFALVAIASAAPADLTATPLLAKLSPQPQAPASTEHATHVAATFPIVQYAPAYYHAPAYYTHAPFSYAAGYPIAYSAPYEAHSYRIAY